MQIDACTYLCPCGYDGGPDCLIQDAGEAALPETNMGIHGRTEAPRTEPSGCTFVHAHAD